MSKSASRGPGVSLVQKHSYPLDEIVERELESWAGTPYLVGAQRKGRDGGVDCCRFVVGVADALSGRATPLDVIPEDASLHDGQGTNAAMMQIGRLCNASLMWVSRSLRNVIIEVCAGDVIVSAIDRSAGAGHARIVGNGCCWHATRAGVRKTGLNTAFPLFIWKPEDKSLWVKRAIPCG